MQFISVFPVLVDNHMSFLRTGDAKLVLSGSKLCLTSGSTQTSFAPIFYLTGKALRVDCQTFVVLALSFVNDDRFC